MLSSLLMLGCIGLAGFLCQWLAYKIKLPAILLLLLTGILLGPTLSLLDPDLIFGDLLFPYISLSVAVILFEGALTLRLRELTDIGRPVRNMVTFGVIISQIIVMCATHYLIGLSWELSALFGAIMVVTGPTVIMPMLKTVRPNTKIGDVLRWEGIIIDPIGALLAVLIFEWIVVQNSNHHLSDVAITFAATIAIGTITGLVAGYIFGLLLKKHLIPETLQNFAALALVCFVFAFSDSIEHESGLLAVTVMGILLTNMKDVNIRSILEFKEDLTIIFVSSLFIVLAARLDFSGFAMLGWNAVLIFIAIQFIARPLKIVFSFLRSNFSWQERAMVAWVGPRGIVAAAVTAVFSLRLNELGIAQAELLVPLSFSIIIGTVVFQSLTARPVAKLLKVAQPETHGILIIGSNVLSIQLAQALKTADVESLVCETNWDKLSEARLAGLTTYYGNPSSEHAHLHLNFSPYGVMLGLSNHHEYNVSQAAHFKDEFGSRAVYILPPKQNPDRFHKHLPSHTSNKQMLFSSDHSYIELKKQLNSGAKIITTELSDEYDFKQWQTENSNAWPLFVIKNDGDIVFNTIHNALEAKSGNKLFYLSVSNTT